MSDQQNDGASMQKVRELLFGSQLDEVKRRIQQQEENIARQLAALREEIFASIKEMEFDLSRRLEAEAFERDRKQNSSEVQITALRDELEERAILISGVLKKTEHSLKELIKAENIRLTESMEGRYREALESLAANAFQLRQDMVDKGTISALLVELAQKLAPSPQQPTNFKLPEKFE